MRVGISCRGWQLCSPKWYYQTGVVACFGQNKVGKVGRAELEEIAKVKMPDLSAYDMDQAVKIIAGSARSMGIETEGV